MENPVPQFGCRMRLACLLLFSFSLATSSLEAVPKSSAKFTASFVEKAVMQATPQGFDSQVKGSSKFTVNATLLLQPDAALRFNADTPFRFGLGAMSISHTLGDDPSYTPGRAYATFRTVVTAPDGALQCARTTTLKWKKGVLTISVQGTCNDHDAAGWEDPGAKSHDNRQSGPIASSHGGYALLGADSTLYSVSSKGSVNTRDESPKGGTPVPITSVKLSGKGVGSGKYLPRSTVTTAVKSPLAAATIGAEGGQIMVESGELAGLTLIIPEGALDRASTFEIAEVEIEAGTSDGSLAKIGVSIHSNDISEFDKMVTVTVPSPPMSKAPLPFYIREDGSLDLCEIVDVDEENRTFTFGTYHLSRFSWTFDDFIWEHEERWYGYPKLATGFDPKAHGFSASSDEVYLASDRSAGMCRFALWMLNHPQNGKLYELFSATVSEGSWTGTEQDVIAERSQHSIVSWDFPGYQASALLRYSRIMATMAFTGKPVMLRITGERTRTVLAIGGTPSGIDVYDPYTPGETNHIEFSFGSAKYDGFDVTVQVVGESSLSPPREPFQEIFDAGSEGFEGTGLARIELEAPQTDRPIISDQKLPIRGTVKSGWVRVQTIAGTAVATDGSFSSELEQPGSGWNLISLVPLGSVEIEGIQGVRLEDIEVSVESPGQWPSKINVVRVPLPLKLEVVSGNNQTGLEGSTLPIPLAVQVRDANGVALDLATNIPHNSTVPSLATSKIRPMVRWRILSDTGYTGGFLTDVYGESGKNIVSLDTHGGISEVVWRTGTQVIQFQEVEVTVAGLMEVWDPHGTPTFVTLPITITSLPVRFTAFDRCDQATAPVIKSITVTCLEPTSWPFNWVQKAIDVEYEDESGVNSFHWLNEGSPGVWNNGPYQDYSSFQLSGDSKKGVRRYLQGAPYRGYYSCRQDAFYTLPSTFARKVRLINSCGKITDSDIVPLTYYLHLFN